MSPNENYYDTLGVPPDANEATIRDAYRRLAKENHPDTNNDEGAAERFRKIDEAWKTLKDPERRAGYNSELARSTLTQFERETGFRSGSPFGFTGVVPTPDTPARTKPLEIRVGDIGLLSALIEANRSIADGTWEVRRPPEDTRLGLPETLFLVTRQGDEIEIGRMVLDWTSTHYSKNYIEISTEEGGRRKYTHHPTSVILPETTITDPAQRFEDVYRPPEYGKYLKAVKELAEEIARTNKLSPESPLVEEINASLRLQVASTYRTGETIPCGKREQIVSIPLVDLPEKLKSAEGLVRRIDGDRTPEGQSQTPNNQGVEGTSQKG